MDYITDYGPVVVNADTGETVCKVVRRPATEAEQAEIDACRAAGYLEAVNAPIVAQITALEAEVTARRVREALVSGDMSFIDNIDAQIVALRAQLVQG